MKTEINVDEFVARETARLHRFAAEWKIESAKDPEVWPPISPEVDWHDQFQCYEG